ncbi:MAG: AhpC/TSA family protein [Tannerella sp.]|jgi:thiol-disulfide isomerase/thioredoxin|nr:AhpC/TSA family protein [Tannerella sp.]
MKTLKIIVIYIAAALLAACNGGKNRYLVRGTVPGDMLNGETVFMTDYSDGLIIDSTNVISGKFTFKGTVDAATVIKLTLRDWDAEFILEKGVISIDLSDPYSAKGTPLNNRLNDFTTQSANLVLEAREKLNSMDASVPAAEKQELQGRIIDELFLKIDGLPVPFLKEHPNDALGALIFYTWMQNQKEPSSEKFNAASRYVGDCVLNFGPVKQMKAHYEKLDITAVGRPFVDFTVEKGNRDGSAASLSDYVGKGKYVLVDFWSSWCQPCRMESRVIAEVYEKYRGDRFEALGVAVWDKRENTLSAIEEDGIVWPQILNGQAIPAEAYGIEGIPHIILFGPDGTILARNLRGNKLRAKIAEVMR